MSSLRRASDRPRTYTAALILIVVALLAGGASRVEVIGSLVVTLVALAVAAYLVWITPKGRLLFDRHACWLIGLTLALTIVQVVPLPYALWTLLPGRDVAEQIYASIGATPWLGTSLVPHRTMAAFFALIAPAVAFVAVSQLELRGRRNLALLVVMLAAASAMLAVVQMAAGPSTMFRIYTITSREAGVGVFANPNHQGLLMAIGAVLLLGWLGDQFPRRGPFPTGPVVGGAALLLLLAVGVLLAGSRAGVLFYGTALVAGALVQPFERIVLPQTRRGPAIVVAGTAIVLAIAAVVVLLTSGAGRELLETRSDARATNIPLFLRIALDFFPFGSGLGSFDPVFRSYETPDTLTLDYLNQAHNEPAQLLIEAGVGGVLLMTGVVAWIIARGRIAWAGGLATFEANRLSRVAVIAVGMMLVHSLVDYPMRTPALAVVFAVLCAMLTDAPFTERRRNRRD